MTARRRPGCYAEAALVDERITGRKPRTLSDVEAAVLPLTQELARIGVPAVPCVISLTHTDQHCAHIVEALAPQGHLALIDDPGTLDAMPLICAAPMP